jgi:hypothetical protein
VRGGAARAGRGSGAEQRTARARPGGGACGERGPQVDGWIGG